MSQVVSSIQCISFRKMSGANIEALNLLSCPGRHLTSLRPCVARLQTECRSSIVGKSQFVTSYEINNEVLINSSKKQRLIGLTMSSSMSEMLSSTSFTRWFPSVIGSWGLFSNSLTTFKHQHRKRGYMQKQFSGSYLAVSFRWTELNPDLQLY